MRDTTFAGFLSRHKNVLILLGVLALVVIVMSRLSRYYLSLDNLLESTRLGAEIGIIAVGMALVILLGGIDLSVGSMFAVSAVMMGMVLNSGWGAPAALLAGIAAGTLLGAVNGLIVSCVGIPPIIATLGTISLYRGVAMGISRGKSFPVPEELYDLIGGNSVLGVPIQFLIFLLASFAVLFMLDRTTTGRSLIATGNNAVAARFSGVGVGRIKFLAYALCGFFCGVAAVLFCCRVTSAKADFGMGYELDAITIVVLGGASLKGGTANILGALLGMLILIMTRRGLTMALVQPEVQTIVFGLLLIAAVGVNSLSPGRDRGRA